MDASIQRIEEVVASHFGQQPDCFRGEGKDRATTDARHFLIYILFDGLGVKMSELTERYGFSKRNIYTSAQIVREGIRKQPFFARHYMSILRELEENISI